jgi:hypothetical protein
MSPRPGSCPEPWPVVTGGSASDAYSVGHVQADDPAGDELAREWQSHGSWPTLKPPYTLTGAGVFVPHRAMPRHARPRPRGAGRPPVRVAHRRSRATSTGPPGDDSDEPEPPSSALGGTQGAGLRHIRAVLEGYVLELWERAA